MIAGIIIVVLLVLYCAWVIRRKVRQMKNGQYCSCGCGGCTKNCASDATVKTGLRKCAGRTKT